MKKISQLMLGLFVAHISFSSFAEATIGLGIGYGQKPYKGDDNSEWLPVPIFEYENGPFYIKGLEAGANVWNTPTNKLSVKTYYSPLRFTPSKSSGAMKQLNKRKSTVMAGVGYTHWFDNTGVHANIATDILDNSNSVLADVSVSQRINVNSRFTIIPTAGLAYANADHNDYYFGVSQNESNRSGIKKYSADSGFTPFIGVGANYRFTKSFSMFAAGRLDLLSKEVRDSPMVNKSVTATMTVGGKITF